MSGSLLCVIGKATRDGFYLWPWIVAIYDDGILLARRPWREAMRESIWGGAFTEWSQSDLAQYKQAELWDRCSRREQLLARRRSYFVSPSEIFNATLYRAGLGEVRLTLRLTDGSDVERAWMAGEDSGDPFFDEAETALRTLLGTRLRA